MTLQKSTFFCILSKKLLWMVGWMDLLSGTGVATALRNVQWPKPFHTPAQPLRLGWLFQRTKPLQGYNY